MGRAVAQQRRDPVKTYMSTLDQVLQSATDESTVEDSLIALTGNIKSQLDAALSGTTVAPAVQAKIDAIFTQIESNKAKVAAAVLTNTPSAPAA
jgi:hypothetical protein